MMADVKFKSYKRWKYNTVHQSEQKDPRQGDFQTVSVKTAEMIGDLETCTQASNVIWTQAAQAYAIWCGDVAWPG